MASDETKGGYASFVGTGWAFPPEFTAHGGTVAMTSDEVDIEQSLRILFGTRRGERVLQPDYGLDVHDLLFEPVSTTLRALFVERARVSLLLHEPRIKVLSLRVESPDPNEGSLHIVLEYEVRATNSRFNLVFPFYLSDASEVVGVRPEP